MYNVYRTKGLKEKSVTDEVIHGEAPAVKILHNVSIRQYHYSTNCSLTLWTYKNILTYKGHACMAFISYLL